MDWAAVAAAFATAPPVEEELEFYQMAMRREVRCATKRFG